MNSRERWAVLATVAAGLLLISLDNSILYTALPTLVDELGATSSESLWIINAYPVVMAGLLLGAGTLGDRVGHRRMFLIGLVVFGAASLAAAFSPTPEFLIASRAVLAVGAAAMMPATLALIRLTFEDERERNIGIGVWGSMAVVGSSLGPILSGLLLSQFSWGSVFLVNVPVVIAAFIATVLLAPHNDADPTKKWDLLSSVLALVALVALVITIKETAKVDSSVWVIVVALTIAIVGAVLFVRRQAVLPYPLLVFSIFRNPVFLAGTLAAGFAMFTVAGVQLVTTQRFQLVEGFTPLEAGLMVAAIAAGSLPTSILGGAFVHRTGLLPLVSGGLGTALLGVTVAVVSFDSAVPIFVAGLVLTGLGLGATMSVASAAIIGNVPASRAGMASSIEEVSYEFGNLTAVALLGSLATAVFTTTLQLPDGADGAARDSIDSALTVAEQNPAIREALVRAAGQAYDGGYTAVMIVVAVVLALGVVTTGVLLRRHGPGSDVVTDHQQEPARTGSSSETLTP
ncbi:DHA2 family multidrug resistance protein-like MFS transporter [Rathayibacter sp. PhB151]|uniref:MFS transporter n=1 Tax=Rathayibacter sp. PhB151 TaxID=2485189 RepID=UPI0010633EAB|nr:MFS transporter [Rathayibacter sp. PhB151]TDX79111.1 DHA2 family multidrug resistance protein-like MFS transporter [Rathayibacter sp. PhB151]